MEENSNTNEEEMKTVTCTFQPSRSNPGALETLTFNACGESFADIVDSAWDRVFSMFPDAVAKSESVAQ
jgi:hypothetical protein